MSRRREGLSRFTHPSPAGIGLDSDDGLEEGIG